MKLVLVGQPNCGKSTIFNAVAGYKAATANFPGTSVSYTTSRVLVEGRDVEVVDLPGTYSLTSQDEAERQSLRYLTEEDASVLINVVDASRLGRALELTLQLVDLGRPMVLALNMADEAQRKGIEVDAAKLVRELGLPVIVTIARRGLGLTELFAAALDAADRNCVPPTPRYDREVEDAAAAVEELLLRMPIGCEPRRLTALKLLERDPRVHAQMSAGGAGGAGRAGGAGDVSVALAPQVEAAVAGLERLHGWPGEQVISGARHALAHRIEERVARVHRPRTGWREKADLVLMHPIVGIPVLLGIMALFFWIVFGIGKHLEDPLVALFDRFAAAVAAQVPPDTIAGAILKGLVLGVSGGVAIVLPYLLPFLAGLAALEDSGYLPRMAYLLDGVMHRIGLHGKSIVPLMLGYGCSVPAVMATRILENPRDRRITAALSVLVPCSARTTVILGLVGAILGIGPALAIYVVNLVVIALLGIVLQKKMKGAPPGLVLEVPDLRAPSPKTMGARTWIALKEFVIVAWPALIVSSIVLGLLEIAHWDKPINGALSPLTATVLGLPAAVGLTLVFGVLRKELALMMLMQALGTSAVAAVLSPAQMITFALFIVFYVPCVATIAALWKELGWKDTAWICALSGALAVAIGVAGRFAVGAWH